jgi:hypothetical protein
MDDDPSVFLFKNYNCTLTIADTSNEIDEDSGECVRIIDTTHLNGVTFNSCFFYINIRTFIIVYFQFIRNYKAHDLKLYFRLSN